jgi:hypothetical protein
MLVGHNAFWAFPYGSGYSLQWLAFQDKPFPLLSLTRNNKKQGFKLAQLLVYQRFTSASIRIPNF